MVVLPSPIFAIIAYTVLMVLPENACHGQEIKCYHHETLDISIEEWVTANGGMVHESIERRTGPYGRGYFATADIEAGAVVVKLPLDLVIPHSNSPCDTIQTLREDMADDKCSKYYPYFQSIAATAAQGGAPMDLPSAWDEDVRDLVNDLPPYTHDWNLHTNNLNECGFTTNSKPSSTHTTALFTYVTRSNAYGLTPVLDIFNHGYHSTSLYIPAHDPNTLVLKTSRSHAAGDELLLQYRDGVGVGMGAVQTMLGAHLEPVGSPELFRDYGFLEQFPTLWWFTNSRDERHSFIVVDGEGNVEWMPSKHKHNKQQQQGAIQQMARDANTLRSTLVSRTQQLTRKHGISCDGNQCSANPNVNDDVQRARHIGLAMSYRQAFIDALQSVVTAAEIERTKQRSTGEKVVYFEEDGLVMVYNEKRAHMGVEQNIEGDESQKENIGAHIEEIRVYLRDKILSTVPEGVVYRQCQNTHELCAFWSMLGECQNNPDFMLDGCALACKSC